MQEKVGKFLAGLASRKDEVRRRCRTVLQSRVRRSCEPRGPILSLRQMHIPPWLWFRPSWIISITLAVTLESSSATRLPLHHYT